MGVIQVKLSDENHKKLNILCILYKKTQDEIINMLLQKAKIPGADIEFLIADEREPTVTKVETKQFDTKLDFLEAE
jgi:hypothetical protein